MTTGNDLPVGRAALALSRVPGPPAYCLVERMSDPEVDARAPWAPGRREELSDVERAGAADGDVWCMSEVDIFSDLSVAEMAVLADAAPMRGFAAGDLLYSPLHPTETLFILKAGRVRIFRVSPDGRALTTAIVVPGTIFGDMRLLGQQMHDSFAEALDAVTVCVMDRRDVERFLLSDVRIAARISELLGDRVSQLERRLSDSVFKSVPEWVATTLCLLADEDRRRPLSRGAQVALTHEQLAALVGTSRETTSKVLGELAERGLVRLGRGRINILDRTGLAARSGD